MEAIVGSSVEGLDTSLVTIALDASPHDDDVVGRVEAAIHAVLRDVDLVLIDFAHPRVVSLYAVPEWILYRALANVRLHMSDTSRVFVHMETVPGPGERLYGLFTVGAPTTEIQFIDQHGEAIGATVESPEVRARLEAFASAAHPSLLSSFVPRFVRRRGVFERPGRLQTRYFQYQYSLFSEIAYGMLAKLIQGYVEENDIDVLIYSDHARPGWLEPAIVEVNALTGLPWASVAHLDLEDDSDVDDALIPLVAEARERVRDRSSRVGVFLPAYRDGLTHGEVEAVLHQMGCDDFALLAVIADSSMLSTEGPSGSWWRSMTVSRGAKQHVDYFFDAPIDSLEAEHWSVRAAKTLNESGPMSMDGEEFTRVGLWSLLAHYGAGAEHPVPTGRPGVRWYPQLAEMEDWDAHWLLHLLVREVCATLQCEPIKLLLVAPDEANASPRLMEHAKRIPDLRAVTISRDEILGRVPLNETAVEAIRAYERAYIVAVDESRITGGTLDAISARVREQRGRPCDAEATVISTQDGPAQSRPSVSLFSWSPILRTEPS